MDGENNGRPYFLMDDLGGNTPIFGNSMKCNVQPSGPSSTKAVSVVLKDGNSKVFQAKTFKVSEVPQEVGPRPRPSETT